MAKILVSACLLGCQCRYDGASKPCEKVLALAQDPENVLIPVCPEQMGGLTTPRNPSERQRNEEDVVLPLFLNGPDGNLPPQAGAESEVMARPGAKSITLSQPRALIMNDGTDVSENYARGVKIALQIAALNRIDYAILKSGSPSCGKGLIYDGSFSGTKVPGNGVTTDALLAAGYKVISEEDL